MKNRAGQRLGGVGCCLGFCMHDCKQFEDAP